MAQKITEDMLNRYLRNISKPELVAWLVERCRQDENLRASLLDLATPKEDAEVLTSEIEARIAQAWQVSQRRDGWKMAAPIAHELDEVLVSLRKLADKGCLLEAERLLVAFIKKSESNLDEIDDSYGYLCPVCQEGVTLWGEIWSQIEPRDTVQLANFVYAHIHNNDYAVKDDMICKFAKALGHEGLHSLQWRLRGDLAKMPQPRQEEPDWKRDFRRRQIVGWLKNIADSLNDVDEYIAIAEAEHQTATDAVPISRRLFEAGRAQEALDFLEGARVNRGFAHGELYDYRALKVRILIALDQREEARDTLWQEFTKCLSWCTFEQVLELTPDEQRETIHQKAISMAQEYRSAEEGAYFLVQMNELEGAARLIEQRHDEISGSSYSSLSKVAEALADSYPSQAWLIYKSLLLDILNGARYKAYHHGANYLMLMERFAERSNLQLEQAEFVRMLQQDHGRKRSFWAKVKPAAK